MKIVLLISLIIIVIIILISIIKKFSEKYINTPLVPSIINTSQPYSTFKPSQSPSLSPSLSPSQSPYFKPLNTPSVPYFINTSQPYSTFKPSTNSPNIMPSSPTLKGPGYNLQTPYPNINNILGLLGLWKFNTNFVDYGIVNISYNKSKKIWDINQLEKNKRPLPKNIYIKIENQKFVLKIDSLRKNFILEWKDNKLISSKDSYVFKRI